MSVQAKQNYKFPSSSSVPIEDLGSSVVEEVSDQCAGPEKTSETTEFLGLFCAIELPRVVSVLRNFKLASSSSAPIEDLSISVIEEV
ncbi:hypothetical protein BCV02_05085 [Vibrio breoganii]|uniref:Uncharacterized protein n=1 Tax=Vibrio breoganii TaxID=553239 RepID=A0ABX1UEE6_9VIBR|nr:hypothetical protein [Vibrio breoganii]NMO74810.1 hypothetical protein [Vibrio breoganii]NMR71467.1 hypothetical protein [Vibrio breoganii]PMG05099.1 hypothetical protein BCV02_05085 [Vibrio breoganii]PML84912.1 hypothetical protein BCT67_15675 [Vibrio breoganii]